MDRSNTGRLAAALAIASLAALACGSGGGGSTGGGTAASEGPIQGFGSVILNGVRWQTDDADFEIDGGPGGQDDLELGMVVRIEGRRDGGGAVADRVVFDTRLRGPVRAVEELGPDSRALEVFGIRVLVSRSGTRFRDLTLDDLETGLLVEASGLVDARGDLEATWLRLRGSARVGDEVKLYGTVEGLAGGSFLLRDTEVFFDPDDVDDVEEDGDDEGELANGQRVRVEGRLLANDDVDAEEIEPFRRGRDDDDFAEVEIHGIVSSYSSLASFAVADRVVDASGARLSPNDPSLVRDGVRVEVEGRLDERGVLVADRLRLRSARVKIEAALASDDDVDPVSGSLWLLGIPIRVAADARLEDELDDRDELSLFDLRAGDFLEVEGVATPDGEVLANEIEREDDVDDVQLEGPVDLIEPDARRFTILGVFVPTDIRTEFEREDDDDREEPLSEERFYDLVRPGDIVQAKDREDGDASVFDVADEVELEEEDLEDDDLDFDDDDPDFDDDRDEDEDDEDDDS